MYVRSQRLPELEEAPEAEVHVDEPWNVLLFNDEVHTFDEVILQLMKATGCSVATAEEQAWTVHSEGKCTVYSGGFEACLGVQRVLNEIALMTEIRG